MRGRVGSLIALGAGFNPILTGRENIYINGSVLGLSKKEIDGKIDKIIDFAEIGEFIDSPVMNYSSGMNVRLGFSVAANLINPDILILDEVLAVGDDQFRLKCLDRVGRLLSSGVAGILVTHQMQNIERICTQCNVMSHGRTALHTWDIAEAIKLYRGLADEQVGEVEYVYGPNAPLVVEKACYDNKADAVLIDFRTLNGSTRPVFATYAVYRAGSELLRGNTLEQKEIVMGANSGPIKVCVPAELRRLGDLKLNTTLWDAGSKQPMVWIKGVSVPCGQKSPYRVSYEPLAMAH
jgi:energy-coupling factor transporter ATP-binding protein EcfA2